MARAGEGLVDRTPLDGPRIDVGVRIGWLLRTSRVHAGLSLREMAGAISAGGPSVSFSTLSRLEAQGLRVGALVDAYERALGLPVGHLRAPVDILCRTFDYAPVDSDPWGAEPDLELFSDAVDAVAPGGTPAAGAWMLFARLHAAPTGFGLTRRTMLPLVGTLLSELARSVAPTAYTARYEALATLRCSAYAAVVEEAVRDFATGGAPAVGDAFSALAERPTPSALAWCGELLRTGSPRLVRGAILAVENMRSVGGLPDGAWQDFVPNFLAAFERPDTGQRVALTRLYKTLSPSVRRTISDRLTEDLVAVPGPREWTRTRRNVHYAWVEQLTERTGARGAGEQEMLTRLLFELLFDFRLTRSATSGFLLNASPYAHDVQEALAAAAVDADDAMTRDMARDALLGLLPPREPARLADWPAAEDLDLARVGHVLLGHAGVPVEARHLVSATARGGAFARSAVYAAGMAGHPHLTVLRDDPGLAPDLREDAAWFLREGARVTH